MKTVEAGYKYYNANSRDANVGDCVKRSLSLALKMDYDEVSKALNRIKRELGASQYNADRVFIRFLKSLGYQFQSASKPYVSVNTFCALHPLGTWLCLTGRKNSDNSSHMLCIIDGDVYDSWNSLNDKVFSYVSISQNRTEFPELDILNILYSIESELNFYCIELQDKYPAYISDLSLAIFRQKDGQEAAFTVVDDTTGVFMAHIKVAKDFKYSEYKVGKKYAHKITVKLNPQASESDNVKSLIKKCKQKLYDWVYNVQKSVKDSEAMAAAKFDTPSPLSWEGLRIAVNLPTWVHPYIHNVWYDSWDKVYNLTIRKLPEDLDNRFKYKSFSEYSLRELKHSLEEYRSEVADSAIDGVI